MNRPSILALMAISFFVSASAAWASTDSGSDVAAEGETKSLIHAAERDIDASNPIHPNPCSPCHHEGIPTEPMPHHEAHGFKE